MKFSIKEILVRFAGRTSLVGPSHIQSASSTGARLVWCFALCGAICAMSAHLYWLMSQFFTVRYTHNIDIYIHEIDGYKENALRNMWGKNPGIP